MNENIMHIGFDDTDSLSRGCTTYVAALLVEKLLHLKTRFVDYPNLVRLNPNVPWKTRGNGALCLRIQHDHDAQEKIREIVANTVEEHSDLESEGTDPGVVFFKGSRIPMEFRIFARNAITGVVTIKDAIRLLAKFKVEAVGFKSGQGIIGALAAIGNTLQGDHTYEILAYRTPENCGSKRKVDETSIFRMDEATAPYTFNNVDIEKGRVIITPRGPDPILFGIRGETPQVVKQAFEMVKPLEPVERWIIFRTNQGTDAHLKKIKKLDQILPYSSVVAKAIVSANPKVIRGRHVIFSIKDESGQVDCAAYEPTDTLRRAARELVVGDHLEVYGGVRAASSGRSLTINLEKIRVLKLAPRIVYQNPVCPACGKRLKSMGKDQGFRCEKCRQRYAGFGKVEVRLKRDLRKGLYVTSARSQRHLTKPLRRYGMEKRGAEPVRLVADWHFP
jgi:tRNA(Ile2)-agmatinylcytidine synthase